MYATSGERWQDGELAEQFVPDDVDRTRMTFVRVGCRAGGGGWDIDVVSCALLSSTRTRLVLMGCAGTRASGRRAPRCTAFASLTSAPVKRDYVRDMIVRRWHATCITVQPFF